MDRRRFGGIYEKPLRPKLVQTFGGRSDKPTADMVESHSRTSAYSTVKKKKKKKGKISKEERLKLEEEARRNNVEAKKKRDVIQGKMKMKKEKRYTNVGGTLVPSKVGSVDWRGKERVDRMKIAVPKPTAAGYGQGKLISGSLAEETTMDKLAKIKEKAEQDPSSFLN